MRGGIECYPPQHSTCVIAEPRRCCSVHALMYRNGDEKRDNQVDDRLEIDLTQTKVHIGLAQPY